MNRLLALAAVCALLAIPATVVDSHEPPPGDLPVGTILPWHNFGKPTTKPPAGWQLCDGSEITDPAFVAVHGKGRRAPNLNGAKGERPNAGQPAFLRGAVASPAGGYGGADRHRHAIPHVHPVGHQHDMAHTHLFPHRHRVALRTSSAGGMGRGGKEGFGGTGRHTHDVRGQTDDVPVTTTRAANPAKTGNSARLDSGSPRTTTSASTDHLPRHFAVTYIIKVR